MSFGQHRHELVAGEWKQISTAADSNVTIDNYGVDAYQFVYIVSGPAMPQDGAPLTAYRTVRPQAQQVLTNLDEGTVLWAMAPNAATVIEVLTG